ncbi:nucleotidyltransferase domain-containing protein [Sulfobacillus sp. hq2]|uniref:nucleotidyltransferase family protein n=1 Tax=Sulfobacillus sp. hq2 TaxID=2039167 RepID=UPI001A9A56B9
MLAPLIQRHLPDVLRFCQQERIDSLAVFGSATRNDFREESDIDLVVRFAPGQRVGFVRLLSIQDRLSEIFEGALSICIPCRRSIP